MFLLNAHEKCSWINAHELIFMNECPKVNVSEWLILIKHSIWMLIKKSSWMNAHELICMNECPRVNVYEWMILIKCSWLMLRNKYSLLNASEWLLLNKCSCINTLEKMFLNEYSVPETWSWGRVMCSWPAVFLFLQPCSPGTVGQGGSKPVHISAVGYMNKVPRPHYIYISSKFVGRNQRACSVKVCSAWRQNKRYIKLPLNICMQSSSCA